MKKVFVIISAAVLACTTASAQSGISSALGGLLNKATEAAKAATSTSTSVSLDGTYTYKSSAIALEGSNALTNLSSGVVESQVQQKLDEYLAMVGIKEGAATYTFSSDGTFSSTVNNIPISGTYTLDGTAAKFNFGKTMKYLTADATVSSTSDGVKILFDGDKFLSIVKELSQLAKNSSNTSISAISTLLESYNGLKIGFNLKK